MAFKKILLLASFLLITITASHVSTIDGSSHWKITSINSCSKIINTTWDSIIKTFKARHKKTGKSARYTHLTASEKNDLKKIISGRCDAISLTFLSNGHHVEFRATLKKLLYVAAMQELLKDALSFCKCTPLGKRVTTVLLLLENIRKKFPDTNYRLKITSFGTGGLFQEYLLLSCLFDAGYTRIHINLIDIEYPPYRKIINAKTDLTQLETIIINDTSATARNKPIVNKRLFAFVQKLLVKHLGVSIRLYNHGYEYLTCCDNGTAQRSDVLYVVDPGWSIRDSHAEIDNANVIIAHDSRQKDSAPDMLIFVPRHNTPHIFKKDTTIVPKKLSSTIEQISPVHTLKDLCKGYSLTYASDPFTAFQDLVAAGTANKAIIFSLQQQIIGKTKDSSRIEHIVPQNYKKTNVALKYSSQYLQRTYEGKSYQLITSGHA